MAWHLLPRERLCLILPRLSLDDMVHLRTLDCTARAAVDGTVPLYVLRAHCQQVLQLQQQLAAERAKERQWLDSNLNMSVADIPLYEAAGACFAPRAPPPDPSAMHSCRKPMWPWRRRLRPPDPV